MKLNTNIALIGNNGSTQPYKIELIRGQGNTDLYRFAQYQDGYDMDYILENLLNDQSLLRIQNEWYWGEIEGNQYNLPSSIVRFYFPQYSADTYSSGVIYILDIYTYIHGHKVDLGSRLFKRGDALACPIVGKGSACEYYEYLDFEIPDPFLLHYGDDTEEIRQIMGEPAGLNATGAVLSFSLSVVEQYDDHYILRDGWTSGQNGAQIVDWEDLGVNINYDSESGDIVLKLRYNSTYNDLSTYLRETYNISTPIMIWQYVLMDKDNVYFMKSRVARNIYEEVSFDSAEIGLTSWAEWKEGTWIQGSVSITNEEYIDDSPDSYLPFMTVFSNKIILSQDQFSIMVRDESDNFPRIVDLNELDNMNNYNITIPNEIVQQVTVVTPVDSAKSHMIQPVFYQTRNLGNVNIYPAVTENISINLDAYKSRVSTFAVQIEGVSFKEIGRNSTGVIFKIMGNMLPKETESGTLYILDQTGALVTTGKYTYKY